MSAAASTPIDRGVPLPGVKYPLRQLEPGDSFRVPYSRASQSCAHSLARRAQVQISTRKEGDFLRVWRVA
jgi:hypothetical protein